MRKEWGEEERVVLPIRARGGRCFMLRKVGRYGRGSVRIRVRARVRVKALVYDLV